MFVGLPFPHTFTVIFAVFAPKQDDMEMSKGLLQIFFAYFCLLPRQNRMPDHDDMLQFQLLHITFTNLDLRQDTTNCNIKMHFY